MKVYVLIFALFSLTFTFPRTVKAQSPFRIRPSIRAERNEIREQVKEKIQELKQGLKEKLANIKSQFAKIIGGEITAISGTTLTVSKDGKSYTVNTDSNTHIRRHYWGGSSLSEFSVGNKVNVQGKFTDEIKTTILARMIRNLSIMKRFGVFLGDVTAKNSDNFVINSKKRENQTVYFTTSTEFTKRNSDMMTYVDLQVGHRVRVKGIWDKSLDKISEVVQVKDYSLPLKPTKVVTPTP